MTTLEKVKADLAKPGISERIDKIINRTVNNLYDMILFAEYLEAKHNRGYVVYWHTAGEPHFAVATWEEYYQAPESNTWLGETHWHTNLTPR